MVAQYKSKVMLKAPVGAFSNTFDLYKATTVEPVNSDHMSVTRGICYKQVVAQFRSKVMLKAPTGAFSITFDLYKTTKYHLSMVAKTGFAVYTRVVQK